ncbi:MAG: MNIO family bufferin maturase [Acetobacteraceae bacterium]
MAAAGRAAHGEDGPISASAGIGLRFPHHAAFLDRRPATGWVEVHSENYLNGPALAVLERVRADYPVSLHSVGLSLGSAEGVDRRHLARIAELAARIEPGLMSEHLAWGAVDHDYLADLLPLPLTDESLDVVCRNVDVVQAALRRPILMENPATYLQFAHSTIPETEFLAALVARTGCRLICDVNNIFVSAANHGWDAEKYLHGLPPGAIGEFHLAGHSAAGDNAAPLLLDTHDRPVAPPVWALFEAALRIVGPRPTLIEWDAAIPALPVLLAEADRAQRRLAQCAAGGPGVLAA